MGEPLEAVLDAALANRREDKETGVSYYSLLRPTRAYARDRVKETDTDNALQNQFVTFYRQVVQENGGLDNQEDVTKRTYACIRHGGKRWPLGQLLPRWATQNPARRIVRSGLGPFVTRQALWDDALPFFPTSAGESR